MPRLLTALLLLASATTVLGQARGNYVKRQSQDNYLEERQQNVQFVAEEEAFNRSYYLNDTTLLVAAQVLYNARPAAYVAVFSLVQVAETTDSVNLLMNERINGFRGRLSAAGITDKDIFVDMISLEAQYETVLERKTFSKRAVEVPAGFELAKNVHVRFRSEEQIHAIMTAAVASEIYDLVKVDYFIPNLEAIYDTLQQEAARLIQRKRTVYETLGVRFEPTYSAQMEERRKTYYPIELYAEYISSSRTSLEVVKKKGKVTTLPERIKSSFYDKPSYSPYDNIFNPEVLSPVVHISYGLRVRYLIRKTDLAPKPAPTGTTPALQVAPGQLLIVPESAIKVGGGR